MKVCIPSAYFDKSKFSNFWPIKENLLKVSGTVETLSNGFIGLEISIGEWEEGIIVWSSSFIKKLPDP